MNGRIPLSQLVEVQPGKYLEPATAAAFNALDRLSRQRYGIALRISDGGAYRTLAEQQQLRDEWEAGGRQGFPPAVPGYSNHGLGTAVDIWNWTHLAAADYRSCGFERDVPGEGWHHHRTGAFTTSNGGAEMDEYERNVVRREARARLYVNTATGQAAAVSIEDGFFRRNDGGAAGTATREQLDGQVKRWESPYLIIGPTESTAAQKMTQGEWDNLIGEVNLVRKAAGFAELVSDWSPSPAERSRVTK